MATNLPPALILAGGLGSRLQPVLPHTPKALAPVAGQVFLSYQLRWLLQNGISKAILCVGYKGEQIVQAFGNGSAFGMELVYSWEKTPLGTGGALAFAYPLLPATFLVVNGDTYTEMPLKPLWRCHEDRGGLATLAVTQVKDAAASGRVELGPDNRVISFCEKQPGAAWVSMGIYAVSKALIAHIPGHRPCSLEKDVFPHIRRLYAYQSAVPFMDIGTPPGYQAAIAYFAAKGNSPSPSSGEEKSNDHP